MKGYIITVDSDTIHGFIKPPNRFNIFKVFDAKGDKIGSYDSDQINSYIIGRDRYSRIKDAKVMVAYIKL